MHWERWLGLVLGALAGCASAPVVPATESGPAAVSVEDRPLPARLVELEHNLDAAFAQGHFPGMAVGVFTRDGLRWSKGYGVQSLQTKAPVTPATVFRVASITKVFTGLAALQLRDEGKLSLDEPASRWVPELSSVVSAKDAPAITLRQLLTHSAGFSHEANLPSPLTVGHPMTEAEVIDGIRGARLAFVPGTGEGYSNAGYAVTGIILGRAAGQPYPDLVRSRILDPLGMRSATFDRDAIPDTVRADGYLLDKAGWVPSPRWWEGALAARGGLYVSLEDLARFGAFELSAWPPRDDAEAGPVRRSTLRESQRTGGSEVPSGQMEGLSWVVSRTPQGIVRWHNGAAEGFQSDLWFSAEAGVGFIALANAFDDPLSLDKVVLPSREILLARPPGALEPEAQAVLNHMVAVLNAPETLEPHVTPEYAVELRQAQFPPKLRQLRHATGPCAVARVLEAHGTRVHATLRCGDHDVDVQVEGEPQAPHRLDSMLVVPK